MTFSCKNCRVFGFAAVYEGAELQAIGSLSFLAHNVESGNNELSSSRVVWVGCVSAWESSKSVCNTESIVVRDYGQQKR